MPAALSTGRKQGPFHETIKIQLSVNSPKVTASNLITSAMRTVNPTVDHLIWEKPEGRSCAVCVDPISAGLGDASHRSWCQEMAGMFFPLNSGRCLPDNNCCLARWVIWHISVSSWELSLVTYTVGGIKEWSRRYWRTHQRDRQPPGLPRPPILLQVTLGPARENSVRS